MNKKLANDKPNKLVITNNFFWYFHTTILNYFTFTENLYFLFLGIVQLLTGVILPTHWSPTGRYSTMIPLFLCVFIEILLVYKKYFSDKMIEKEYNNKKITILENKILKQKNCDELQVGDIMVWEDTEPLVIDGFLLKPAITEISTILINGESNLKYVKSIGADTNCNLKIKTMDYDINDIFNCNAELNIDNETTFVTGKNFIPNGSIVKSSCVIYVCGVGKKNSTGNTKINKKQTLLDGYISDCINKINIKLLICMIILMIVINLIHQDLNKKWFEIIIDIIMNATTIAIQSWILFNNIIPFSVKILIVFVRNIQAYKLNLTKKYKINNANVIDDFNRIKTILSDKTGTITQGKLSVKKLIEIENNEIKEIKEMNLESMLVNCIIKTINKNLDNTCSTNEDEILDNFCKKTIDINYENDLSHLTFMKFDLLQFTFERKRSSNVIIENDGTIKIFSKGSLDSMRSICYNIDDLNSIETLVNKKYSGYKLLVYGYRIITKEELDDFEINQECDILENNLEIIGAVCFSDKLCYGINDLVTNLREKNIKFNLCTGDRQVTSVQVAKKAGLLVESDYLVVFNDQDFNLDKNLIFDNKIVEKYYDNNEFITCLRFGKNFVAYNMTPKNKQTIAKILNYNSNCLSCGDGHNDIEMFNESHISVSIKGTNSVNLQSDLVVNNIMDLNNYFNRYANNFIESNMLLINFTFYRCILVNICTLIFSLISFYNEEKYETFYFTNLFDGFTLVAFNFLWLIVQMIKYHSLIERNNKKKLHKKIKYNQIIPWIIYSVLNSVCLILFCSYFLHFHEKQLLSMLAIINLNIIYGMNTEFNRFLLVGPLMYFMYLMVIY